jgi:hypothetical protein
MLPDGVPARSFERLSPTGTAPGRSQKGLASRSDSLRSWPPIRGREASDRSNGKGTLVKRTLSLVVLSLFLAAGARAGIVTINFDFSGSSLSMLGGLVNIPPQGSIQSASGTVDVNAAGSATAIGGAAQLRNFQMAATVNAILFGNTITGNAGIVQLGGMAGNFAGGQLNPLAPMQIQQSGFLGCTGPSCAILSLPTTLNGTQALAIAALPIANINNIGNAFISGDFGITFAGFTGMLHLVGTEVSRSFDPIPEPGTAALLALGLAGMAASRKRR